MIQTYLALLRGINVGGNGLIKMAELKDALITCGMEDVITYIQSGNVIFCTEETNTDELAALISKSIIDNFAVDAAVVVFTKTQWIQIVEAAPKWWGADKEWKHNLIALINPYNMTDVVSAIGTLKPDIERIKAGEGVIYQSLSLKLFGRTTSGKIASKPIYKNMTIRNYNTAQKLLSIMKSC